MISTILGMIGQTELIIIVLVILLLFGGKKIPELMKGVGKGIRSFKDGMNDIQNDIQHEIDKPYEPQKKEQSGSNEKPADKQ